MGFSWDAVPNSIHWWNHHFPYQKVPSNQIMYWMQQIFQYNYSNSWYLGSGAGQTSSRCCIVWSNNVNPGFTHDHYLEGTSTINKPWLVGGFNNLETYYSMGRIIPYIKENERWLKPPTRWFLNPGLILSKPETQSCHHCHHIPSRSRSTAQPCLLGFRTEALKIHGIGMR